jgi:hypothetical protein
MEDQWQWIYSFSISKRPYPTHSMVDTLIVDCTRMLEWAVWLLMRGWALPMNVPELIQMMAIDCWTKEAVKAWPFGCFGHYWRLEMEKKSLPIWIPQLSIYWSSAVASQYIISRIDIEQQIIPEDWICMVDHSGCTQWNSKNQIELHKMDHSVNSP